jgi:IS4 transposase
MAHPSHKTRSRPHPNVPPHLEDLNPKAFLDVLTDLFPPDEVRRMAEESGFVKRYRQLDPVAFLLTLVLDTGPEIERTLRGLQHAYNTRVQEDPIVSYNGFYQRFTKELVEFLRLCVAYALSRLATQPGNRLAEKLARFADILIQDSTVIRLSAALAGVYPATRSRKPTAGVKVATLFSARANGPKRLELFGERTAEIDTLKVGPWVKNSILLTDLGFYKHQGFVRIEENGGFYLSRLKGNANPTFLHSLTVHRGRAIELEGKTWRQVAPRLQREALDAEVEIGFSRRGYKGHRTGDTLTARLVAVWDEEHREYHAYLTNIPSDVLTAEDVAELYRVRWSVELLFKEGKGQFHLDRVKTKNRRVAESLIWTAWLSLIASRAAHSVALSALPEEWRARYPPIMWSIAWRNVAPGFLRHLLQRLGLDPVDPEPLVQLQMRLMARGLDPNLSRERFRRGWFA